MRRSCRQAGAVVFCQGDMLPGGGEKMCLCRTPPLESYMYEDAARLNVPLPGR